jgi:hypothetical protein
LENRGNASEQELGKAQQKLAAYQEEVSKLTNVCKAKAEQIDKL